MMELVFAARFRLGRGRRKGLSWLYLLPVLLVLLTSSFSNLLCGAHWQLLLDNLNASCSAEPDFQGCLTYR